MSHIEPLNHCTACRYAIWKARTCIWVFSSNYKICARLLFSLFTYEMHNGM